MIVRDVAREKYEDNNNFASTVIVRVVVREKYEDNNNFASTVIVRVVAREKYEDNNNCASTMIVRVVAREKYEDSLKNTPERQKGPECIEAFLHTDDHLCIHLTSKWKGERQRRE